MALLPKNITKNAPTPEQLAKSNRKAFRAFEIGSLIGGVGYLGSVARIIKQNRSFVKNLRTNLRKTQDTKKGPLIYGDPNEKMTGDILVRKGKVNVYRGEGTPNVQDLIEKSAAERLIKSGPRPIGKVINKLSGKGQFKDSYRPQIKSDIMATKVQLSQLGRYVATDPKRAKRYAAGKRRGVLTAMAEPQYDAKVYNYRIDLKDLVKGMKQKGRTVGFVKRSYRENRADEIKRTRGKLTMSDSYDPVTGKRPFIDATRQDRSIDATTAIAVVQKVREAGRTKFGNPGKYVQGIRNPFTGLLNLKKPFVIRGVDKQFPIPKKLHRKLKR